ncbi:MAG: 30S ribosomal protein S20 [Patescibacteria group bacterium]|nr:30S ribosomal protein S20 [Patescibacteria group bacterium]
MPIIRAAKKAVRSSSRRQNKNLQFKIQVKEAISNVSAKDLSKVQALIDKAAKQHIFSKNKASRIKSQLARKFAGANKKETNKLVKPKKIKKTSAKNKK